MFDVKWWNLMVVVFVASFVSVIIKVFFPRDIVVNLATDVTVPVPDDVFRCLDDLDICMDLLDDHDLNLKLECEASGGVWR